MAVDMMKRAFDIFASLSGLLVLAVPLCIAALAVKMTSPGKAIFCQERIGRNGKPFTIYKLRTMRIRPVYDNGGFEPGDRSRVTPVGKFLRATKLDEFPQLWNVLKGDMSLVGPRPEVEKWVIAYPDRWQKILKVRPGITDPASITFRNEEALLAGADDPERIYFQDVLPKKLDMYERYLENQSFWGDICLIFKTISLLLVNESRPDKNLDAGS